MMGTQTARDRRFGAPRAAWFSIDRQRGAASGAAPNSTAKTIHFEADRLGRPSGTDAGGAWRLTERFGLIWARPFDSNPDLPSLPPPPRAQLRPIAYA